MTSQDFFWMCVVIGVGFVALFLFPRSYQGPTRLRLLGGRRENLPTERKDYSFMSRETRSASEAGMRTKSLNVMFNYNGHSWDAHEVLGVPAGASLTAVTEAYQRTIQNVDPENREFIETAYQAIRTDHQS